MATFKNTESRLYSWWWDSHVSPKNSKWLQDNLTDMDTKVKAMIKLIEEDADSFARRAEMYYKKRPELMKLVEEFYRAYRALAERYNHATGELRHAQRTMAQAFPDQVQFGLADDITSSSEPGTPETTHPIRSFFDLDRSQGSGMGSKGSKQLNDLFEGASEGRPEGGSNSGGIVSHLSKENQMLKSQVLNESERAKRAESELQNLRRALAELEAKRDAIFSQYQQTSEKLSSLEKDLNHAKKGSRDLDGLVRDAKLEIQALKEALISMEAERDASLLQYRQSSEKLANVENLLSQAREDSEQLRKRAEISEDETLFLKKDLAKLQAEKDNAECLYRECLHKIAVLERKLAECEESLKLLSEQSERAENEVKALKEDIGRVKEERDDVALRYKQSLETIAKLQLELSEAQADNIRLKSEILVGTAKLKGSEEKCDLLDKMNESLQLEAQKLIQRIAEADRELSEKQAELEKLTFGLQEEHSRFLQAESTLHTLQGQHFDSQEKQKALTLELINGVQMMKDLEERKLDLEVEVRRLKDENQSLNDLNSSSIESQKNLQEEMLRLKAIKEKLEAQVKCQEENSDVLQLQVRDLKEEIEGLYERYHALMSQLESAGLNPECFASSIKSLQDENLRLQEISTRDKEDRKLLAEKLQDMEELIRKSANLESSLLEVNSELQMSKEHVEAMEKSYENLNEEKSSLVSEKSALLSQLQIITQTLQNVIEKNNLLHDSLSGANSELEGLRAKSKGLEEFCQLLTSERSNILAERSALLSRLVIVEGKLSNLETRFTTLEEKYMGLEKEKRLTVSQVDELWVSLNVERQERACLVITNEARLSGLEGRICDLQEENKYRKKEFEEQLEKAVNAQVEIFILQKFIQDMEDKNYSLLLECQRHIEDAKYSEKIITELESENIIQEMEAELLLEKIDTLRKGINQVLKALEIQHGSENDAEQNFVPCVLGNIRNMKHSLSESKDENEKILLEKSILTTILGQLHIECSELSSRKTALEEESQTSTRRLVMIEDEKNQLLEKGRQLSKEVHERGKRAEMLSTKVEDLLEKQMELQGAYHTLKKENFNAFELNRSLKEQLSHTRNENMILEAGNNDILVEALAFNYQSVILKSYGVEKACEMEIILNELNSLSEAYSDLENESRKLEEKLLLKEMENLTLKGSIEHLVHTQQELIARNDQLRCELSDEKELVTLKDQELSEVELKLKANENLNTELCNTVLCLEKDYENLEDTNEILEQKMAELSRNNIYQENEILNLRDANGNLESELNKLHEEIEEYKIREVILTSELQERSSEFELWEAEATSFYFELQISNVREALFENKVHDLSSLCESLEDVSNRRSLEIENMKQRVTSLEIEADSLRSQLTSCLPLIAYLKDNISLIETNPFLQSKLHGTTTIEEQDTFERTERISTSSNTFPELLKLKNRIKVIEDILQKEKEMAAMNEHSNTNIRLETALKEIEELKTKVNIHHHYQDEHRRSYWVSESETSEGRKSGAEMKDIPLDQASGRSFQGVSQRTSATSNDQMLELWEEAEHNSNSDDDVEEQGNDIIEDEIISPTSLSNPTPESSFEKELGVDRIELSKRGNQLTRKSSKKNTLDRLTSDTKKLVNLQISVEELKRKMEPKKRRKKGEEVEIDSFRGKLLDLENSVVQLMAINSELIRNIEGSSIESDTNIDRVPDEAQSSWEKRVIEQVKKEEEKIEKLEQEMEKMQYVLLRIKDEKKGKGKNESSKSSASIVLREFFYSRVRKSKKPKKSRLCGCIRSTSTKN